MLKTILVGLNGSAYSRAAGMLAMDWAQQHRAQILGVGVVEARTTGLCESFPVWTPSDELELEQPAEDAKATARPQVESLLAEFEQSCLATGLTATAVKESGDVATVLSRYSQRADLLVVGLNQQRDVTAISPLSRTLDKVLANAIHPVVCVPSNGTRGRSVLVAYDGSLQAARTLFAFVGLGLFPQETIRVVAIDEHAEQHAEALALAEQYLTAHGYRTQTERFLVQDSDVSKTLIRHVSEVQPSLVVLGVFGKSWTRSVLCGSVTKRLLHEGCVPLFVYH